MGISTSFADRIAARARSGETIGAGSGSSALGVVEALGRRIAGGDLGDVTLVPTSIEIARATAAAGFRVGRIDVDQPTWLFDGADEIDPAGGLLKGRGGAMLAEKIVFHRAAVRVVVGTPDKRVERLGTKFAVGVEVVPTALAALEAVAHDLGAETELRLAGGGKDGPVITEHGGLILDLRLPEVTPEAITAVETVPGVLTSGAFLGFEVDVQLDDA